MNKILYYIVIPILITILSACSQQNRDNTQVLTEETSPILEKTVVVSTTTTGIFNDSPVSNLHYKCSSGESNVTSQEGKFTCLSDANISFILADFLFLGEVPIEEIITPVTLFKDDAVAALNLIQLLQTLDSDQNPNNGISIDVNLTNKLKDANISFSDRNFDSLISDYLGLPIVSSISAYEHYEKSRTSIGGEKLDVDYIPPTILTNSNIEVFENNKDIITLTVLDKNSVTYTLVETNETKGLFLLDSESGKLGFISPPDYETKKEYSFELKVSDGSNISFKNFTINILDIDENPPIINTPSKIIVSENQQFVVEVNASDESSINYSIEGVDSDFFTIDAQSGLLTFKRIADYEEQSSYTITLIASDLLQTTSQELQIQLIDIEEKNIPTLVVLMNWTNYSQNDALTWHNKIFNKSQKSVSAWYEMISDGEVKLYPVNETYGTQNDGIIMVNMNDAHPGSGDDANFRDSYIRAAITDTNVINNVNFAALDTNHDKEIGKNELQIIFIVAGGEESNGDDPSHSIWAHSWSFDSFSAPTIDGVEVLKYNGNPETSGAYAAFGAKHGTHLATIGIIAHELGHALLNLFDFYDDGGGSGLGWYDIMSGGSWAQKPNEFPGQTPTEFSAFNKREAKFSSFMTTVDSSQTLTIKCSSQESIKLKTSKNNEYFLLECRDTEKVDSDIAFATLDGGFNNRLFTLLYHVDDAKDSDGYFLHSNTEDGTQTNTHHYNLAIVEKETNTLMTSTEFIDGNFADVYTEGDTIDTVATQLYNGTFTNYKIEILNDNYEKRSVTIKITK